MSDPLAITFKFLAVTENPHATDALIAALDVPQEVVRSYATEALILKRNLRGQLELIRRLNSLSGNIREILQRHRGTLDYSLRQSLLQGDRILKDHALTIVNWIEDFQQIPTLLQMLEYPDLPQRPQVIELLEILTQHFYDYLKSGPHAGGVVLREPQQIRALLVEKLERSVLDYEKHNCDTVVESLMILAPTDHQSLRSLLRPIQDPPRKAFDRVLRRTVHPGVLGKFMDYLGQETAPLKILQTIKQRDDFDFLSFLLDSLPKRLNSTWQTNLRKIDTFAWLHTNLDFLEELPGPLQERLVAFVGETNISEADRHRVYTWILQHASPEARSATTRILTGVNQELVQELVMDGIDSSEEEVQAWATSQLRVCNVPQAFQLLINRLDSDLPQVQQAARKELEGFDLKRFLDIFDHIDQQTCIRAGILLRKIDPQIAEKMKGELSHPMRTRRLRMLKALVAAQVAGEVMSALPPLLKDEEVIIRRMTVEALKTIPCQETLDLLRELLENEQHPRVREDALKGCLIIEGLLPKHPPSLVPQP